MDDAAIRGVVGTWLMRNTNDYHHGEETPISGVLSTGSWFIYHDGAVVARYVSMHLNSYGAIRRNHVILDTMSPLYDQMRATVMKIVPRVRSWAWLVLPCGPPWSTPRPCLAAPLSHDNVQDEQVGKDGRSVHSERHEHYGHHAKAGTMPNNHDAQSTEDRQLHPQQACARQQDGG